MSSLMLGQRKRLKTLVLDIFRVEADKSSQQARAEMKRTAAELAGRGGLGGSSAQIVGYVQIVRDQIQESVNATLLRLSQVLPNRWLEWAPWTEGNKELVILTLQQALKNRYRGPWPKFPHVDEDYVQQEVSRFISSTKDRISNEVVCSIDAPIRGKQQEAVKYLVFAVLVGVVIAAIVFFLGLK